MNLCDLLALLSDSMRIYVDKLKSIVHSYIFNGYTMNVTSQLDQARLQINTITHVRLQGFVKRQQ